LFARRAAPVQCSYLGCPGSTGIPNMDWILGDAVVTPTGCEALYSERVARLPGTVYCFAPETDYPYPFHDDSRDDDLLERPLTFGCFNNVPKLTPRTLRLWARILQVLPKSRLLLKAPSFADEGAVRELRSRFEALGVGSDRVVFRGPGPLSDMMAEYADVDIALDPVPFNGGTTTAQALWMGAPVVAMEGANFCSRTSASFLRAAGLDDWVTADDDAYVALAIARGRDREGLLAVKKSLRNTLLASPAWDAVRHTRALEEAFLGMARTAAAS
jgi:protein O-GlcNAc transferase